MARYFDTLESRNAVQFLYTYIGSSNVHDASKLLGHPVQYIGR